MTYTLIRVQNPDDWKAYHAIRRKILFENKGHYGYDPDNGDEYKDNHHPLLLKFNNQAIGTTRLDNFGNGTGAIRLVAITEEAQGHGHGHALNRVVIDYARNLGINTLLVNADPDAIGYYRRMGFEFYE